MADVAYVIKDKTLYHHCDLTSDEAVVINIQYRWELRNFVRRGKFLYELAPIRGVKCCPWCCEKLPEIIKGEEPE